ncbi:MAG: leucyl/phenylalanyl-tRNA--protein transferase [Planctomycetes bacterium]|nr:leucyl/phenylalanyl-tRNA--protein transferase [Planctomycetota bacterium]
MNLDPETILAAYRRGLFPMADPSEGGVAWYDADPRGIIPLDAFHAPRRLLRYMKQFEFAFDRDFEGVIDGCARPVTWISAEIRAAYVALHRRGRAHSVEAWKEGRLAGGLYGVHIGGAFMAESMFHKVSNASGACVVRLVDHLKARGFGLLDIQQVLPNTARFGALEISRADYLRRLAAALKLSPTW